MKTLSDNLLPSYGFDDDRLVITEEDVKQFIKDLKEIILEHYDEKKQEVVNVFEDNKPAIKVELNPIIKKINKLAGDKLIKEQKELNNRSAN